MEKIYIPSLTQGRDTIQGTELNQISRKRKGICVWMDNHKTTVVIVYRKLTSSEARLDWRDDEYKTVPCLQNELFY